MCAPFEIHEISNVVFDLLQSLHWIEEFPKSNIGLVTGYPDSFSCIFSVPSWKRLGET
jgi:hypothetical protein